ncbi:MAG: PepSY domain-containing protein [Comamonas sp.]|jgi:uncharacterized iron-regulated membrane protein|uniref:PepSY-associated TM helix domain-containing protein n=1 Tax=Comamonas sp. TaxID=34028 RepID=UPI0028298876|nr:PepSY-associated TM helix domain-containing protein [Comamonas sp.]MDR0212434.1 PepSY domain-containing protein [Comamonas sp.]
MVNTASGRGAGQGRFRQAQAWLHTWCGLWFSWLLFAIFLTGTLAVFEEPISHWMTPEHHAEEAAALHAAPADSGGTMAQRLAWGLAYMDKHHPGAEMWELWPADAQGAGNLTVYWFDAARAYAQARLDPATGEALSPRPKTGRDTLGGHHFVDFHYRLHARNLGLWLVGAAALAMLVALVSGVIIHRRILQDFFTFRPSKGQRSWLDAHNAAGVLTLPFQLMIVYTGLAISGVSFMPAGVYAFFGVGKEGVRAYYAALNEPGKPVRSGLPMAVPDLEPFVQRGQQLMGQPVRAVVIEHPGDAQARIGVYGWNDEESLLRRLSENSGMALFSAATGELLQVRLPGQVDGGGAALAKSVMGSLHTLKYGGLALKWLYFLCGLAGSAMLATGAVLFMVKRRARHQGEFGRSTARVYRWIEALNVAAIAGLALACIGYLWANRLLPLDLAHRHDAELAVFFGLWLLALVHGRCRPPAAAWIEQLAALAALCLLLPVLNGLTVGDHVLAQIDRGDWESAGVELVALSFGLLALLALRAMAQPRAARTPVDQKMGQLKQQEQRGEGV